MKRREFCYRAQFEPEEEASGFTVTFPDVPEAITYGDDQAEAAANAREALAIALSLYVTEGERVPVARAKGAHLVPVEVSAVDQSKLRLNIEMRRVGVDLPELARRLGVNERQARRIVEIGYQTPLAAIEAAFHAIGRRLLIDVAAA